jgi:hypothetical protein
LPAVGAHVYAQIVWHIPQISCDDLLDEDVETDQSEGFIYRLSRVDEKLLQQEAPAVDYTKLTVHTDTGLSGLLVTTMEKSILP